MANEEHLRRLRQALDEKNHSSPVKRTVWMTWRQDNPKMWIDLSRADLSDVDLTHMDLRRVDLSGANLSGARLDFANLRQADLREARLVSANLSFANLRRADFREADLERAIIKTRKLRRADFRRANLSQADLSNSVLDEADMSRAILTGAKLAGANLTGAKLSRANLAKADMHNSILLEANLNGAELSEANLHKADLRRSNLSNTTLINADLSEADLSNANLINAKLCKANLSRANLSLTYLVDVDFTDATLNNCRIYGVSAWSPKLDGAAQRDLIITHPDEPIITIDNLRVAQFIYLLLRNEEIREVIDSITSKVVLILGRFLAARKVVLDAIREDLRGRGYLPVIFDFSKPASRDLTETISTLAHIARFVIADITDAKSIPQELQAVVPNLPSVPVKPLLLATETEYGMFEHFKRYPWVLETYLYNSTEELIKELDEKVITPAEEKARELTGK